MTLDTSNATIVYPKPRRPLHRRSNQTPLHLNSQAGTVNSAAEFSAVQAGSWNHLNPCPMTRHLPLTRIFGDNGGI